MEMRKCMECGEEFELHFPTDEICEQCDTTLDAYTFNEALVTLLQGVQWGSVDPQWGIEGEVRSVCTFRDASILTWDEGLVLTFANGDEFQITVVKSR